MVFIFLAVSKELECKLEFWRGKQLEIEGKFKDVYSTNLKEIATSGKSKTRKTKKKGQTSQENECSDHANYNLSSYAASLIKEFLIKVSFLPFFYCKFLPCITIRDGCSYMHVSLDFF